MPSCVRTMLQRFRVQTGPRQLHLNCLQRFKPGPADSPFEQYRPTYSASHVNVCFCILPPLPKPRLRPKDTLPTETTPTASAHLRKGTSHIPRYGEGAIPDRGLPLVLPQAVSRRGFSRNAAGKWLELVVWGFEALVLAFLTVYRRQFRRQ